MKIIGLVVVQSLILGQTQSLKQPLYLCEALSEGCSRYLPADLYEGKSNCHLKGACYTKKLYKDGNENIKNP